MHIDQANIFNLKSLWKKYGSQVHNVNNCTRKLVQPNLHINTHWPYRCWFDDEITLNDFSWLSNVPETTIFPIWSSLDDKKDDVEASTECALIEKLLQKNHWHCMLEQTAMFLPLANDANEYRVEPRTGFTINTVATPQDITLWLNIVSDAFGYRVERTVIEKLINDPDMQILMAYQNDQAVASAILYKTGDIIGIHQVGVKKDCQGKGFARSFMKELIEACHLWQGKNIVLQASSSGQPLYEQLGFKAQFLIKNYQRQ